MLLGEQWILKNRYLIINPPAEYSEQPSLDNQTNTQECQNRLGKNIDAILEKLGKRAEGLGKKLGKTKIDIIKLIYQNPSISTVEMANNIGISSTAIDNNIRQMRDVYIRRIGPKKGGYWEIIE